MGRRAAYKIAIFYAVFVLLFSCLSVAVTVHADEHDNVEKNISSRKNVFRLYNKLTGEYLYSSDIEECSSLPETGEWMTEGIVWSYTDGVGTPVYRLFKENMGHRYTEFFDECISMKEDGWKYEGVCWCIDSSNGESFYTMINPYSESEKDKYVYTSSSAEVDLLVRLGWTKVSGVHFVEMIESKKTDNTRTIDNYLKGKKSVAKYLSANRTKYLGIPYDEDYDIYLNKDRPIDEGLQCGGFVCDVMKNVGCDLDILVSETGGNPSQASTWINFAIIHAAADDLDVYVYNSIDELLNDGVAKKGDIILFESLGYLGYYDAYGNMYDNHIGFFYGDGANYDKMWHSAWETKGKGVLGERRVYDGKNPGNQISNVTPMSEANRIYLLPVSSY